MQLVYPDWSPWMWPDTIKQLFRHHRKSQLNHLPKYIQDLKLNFISAKHGWEASRREKANNDRFASHKWLWHPFCYWANTDPEQANKACFLRDSQLASLPGTSPNIIGPFCVWAAFGTQPFWCQTKLFRMVCTKVNGEVFLNNIA